jgi:hypothetical protein
MHVTALTCSLLFLRLALHAHKDSLNHTNPKQCQPGAHQHMQCCVPLTCTACPRQVCKCRKWPGRPGCADDTCLLRQLYVECTPGFCPCQETVGWRNPLDSSEDICVRDLVFVRRIRVHTSKKAASWCDPIVIYSWVLVWSNWWSIFRYLSYLARQIVSFRKLWSRVSHTRTHTNVRSAPIRSSRNASMPRPRCARPRGGASDSLRWPISSKASS